jgi:hypothetical protein
MAGRVLAPYRIPPELEAVFTGLDDIDWAAMHHAYGPAVEVPDLLRGLVSADPAERESALDAMYGAVHHQGDVYQCTVAAIPFLLEAVADRTLPGRAGIVRLLGSIGGADSDEQPHDTDLSDEDDEDDEDDEYPGMFWGTANRAIADACPLLLDLLVDPDPRIREATATTLLTCRTEASRIFTVLRDRLPDEPDGTVRAAILGAVGAIGRRAAAGNLPAAGNVEGGVDTAAVTAWLVERSADTTDNTLRLTALAELAGCAPDALPADVAPTAVALLREVYAVGTPPVEPAGYSTNTLIGSIRHLREREAAGREAADATELVRSLSVALGARVEDRIELLTELLRATEWEARYDALRPAKVLIEGWRGEYTELVRLVGEQLFDPHPRVPPVAAHALEHLDDLAAPAADALARALEAAPREAPHTDAGLPAWVTIWPRSDEPPSPGATLRALAALGDPRALPATQWMLEQPDMAGDAGLMVARYGPAAAHLVPTIVRRLRELPTVDGYDRRRYGLIAALGRIGEASGIAVPDLVPMLPEQVVLVALRLIGPAAVDAVPAVRYLLDDGKPETEIAAASTLFKITGDPEASLPVLVRHLDGDAHQIRSAAEAIAEIGPAASSAVPKLQELAHGGRAEQWTNLEVARALWRTAGDSATAVPLLTALWKDNPYTRRTIAKCLAEMGQAAAPAVPLIREELGNRRRHTARDHGWSSDQVPSDLELLRACETVLTGAGLAGAGLAGTVR